jgi:hypothetical protein
LANLDAPLLEKGPQDQGIPDVGALNRPRHGHNSDTPLSCEAASGIVAGPVSLPPIARVRGSGRVVAVAVPVPGVEHAGAAITAARELPVSSRSPPVCSFSPLEGLTMAGAEARHGRRAFLPSPRPRVRR